MSNIGSDGSDDDDDEFECSECDFKCSSEDDMIKHSSVHRCPETDIDGELTARDIDIITSGCDSYDDSDILNTQSQFNNREKVESNKRLTEKPEINGLGSQKCLVKIEPSSSEEISVGDIYHERDIGSKKIKLEYDDVKLESIPNLSQQPHQIDKPESVPYFLPDPQQVSDSDIHQYQNSQGLFLPKTELNDIRDSTHSDYNNTDISTEDGSLRTKNVDVSNKSSKTQNVLDFTNSVRLRGPKMPHLEIEIDNTGIYIPPGWKRKIFLRSRLSKGLLWYDCYYFTELGNKIRCKKEAHDYHINNPFAKIDFEKLNFSKTKSMINPTQSIWEFDLINTEIYVPEGWQRKLNVSTNDDIRKNYKIIYVNPEGKRFRCKSDLYSYFSHSDSNNTNFDDVDKFDFTSRSYLNLSKSYKKDPEEDNALFKSSHISTEKDKLFTNINFNYPEKNNIFHHLFEVRKIIKNGGNYNQILCKLCSYSCISKANAHMHSSVHIKNISNSFIFDSNLPNNFVLNDFDYFICEACHERIMSRNDVNLHLQSHSNEEISSSIIGVKYVCKAGSKVKMILHCCEYCNFACSRLNDMFKHVNEHSPNTIHDTNMSKYKHPIENDEKALTTLIKDGDLVNINQVDSPLKRKYCGKQALNSIIKDRDSFKINQVDSPLKETFCGKKDIEIDNTGKYIPKGWERRVYHYKSNKKYKCISQVREVYKVSYISPFKRSLHSKTEVSEYIKRLESSGVTLILDVEKMDFSTSSHNLKIKKRYKFSVNREEIEVDSTEMYIPEGWQVKLFKNKNGSQKGKYFICYISPFNKLIWEKQTMQKYITRLEKNGTPLLVELDKIHFSLAKHGFTNYINNS